LAYLHPWSTGTQHKESVNVCIAATGKTATEINSNVTHAVLLKD